jgi:hypothetical protein
LLLRNSIWQNSTAPQFHFGTQLRAKKIASTQKPLIHAVIHTGNAKNTLFISIFHRFLLRSIDSLAIVPSGPDFLPLPLQGERLTPAPVYSGQNEKKSGG